MCVCVGGGHVAVQHSGWVVVAKKKKKKKVGGPWPPGSAADTSTQRLNSHVWPCSAERTWSAHTEATEHWILYHII